MDGGPHTSASKGRDGPGFCNLCVHLQNLAFCGSLPPVLGRSHPYQFPIDVSLPGPRCSVLWWAAIMQVLPEPVQPLLSSPRSDVLEALSIHPWRAIIGFCHKVCMQ